MSEAPSPAAPRLFLGRSRLPLTVTGAAGMLVGVASALMCVVSLGPMAAALGAGSILIWAGAALIGGLQCLLLAELCSRFPERSGGTAQYAYRAWPRGSASVGAVSAWCYWYAWTPGIAVNLILAAGYLHRLFLPWAAPLPLALGLGVLLYALAAAGLRPLTAAGAVLAALAIAVVLLVTVAPLVHPDAVTPLHWMAAATANPGPGTGTGTGTGTGASASDGIRSPRAVAKWAFVASWSAYGGEMASVVAAEVRNARRVMAPVMIASGAIGVLACTLVPLSLFLLAPGEVAGDPLDAFASAAESLLGPAGAPLVGAGLVAVLLLAALAFITGSSRTVYQLAEDHQLPRFFAHLNRRGAPTGSILLDAAVIATMLLAFGQDVVNVVAAANVGYLITFVLMPVAYLVLRGQRGAGGGTRLGRWAVPLAIGLAAVNLGLLVYGGSQWGPLVMGVGLGVSALILPVAALSRRLTMRTIRN